jgi:hypothetical protein
MARPAYQLPAASYHELTAHCVFPWNSGRRWPAREAPGDAQRFGSAFHELAALVSMGQGADDGTIIEGLVITYGLTPSEERRLVAVRAALVAVVADDQVETDSADGDDGPVALPLRWSEEAFAFEPATGKARHAKDRRDKTPTEIFGAADLVFLRVDGVLVVRDWKTGRRAADKRPSETRQLRFLALAAAQVHGADTVRVELAFVDDEAVELVGEDLDALELGAIDGEIAELVERLEAPAVPNPGPWCERNYCPIRSVCPATLAALAKVDADLAAFPLGAPFASSEHAAFVRHRLPVLRAALDAIDTQIEAYALRTGPLPVEGSPGKVWGPRQMPGHERIAATPAAIALVLEQLGPEAGAIAVEVSYSMSKASLERGVRAKLGPEGMRKRGALKVALDPLLEELRAAKVIKRGPGFTKFEVFKKASEDGEGGEAADGEGGES